MLKYILLNNFNFADSLYKFLKGENGFKTKDWRGFIPKRMGVH